MKVHPFTVWEAFRGSFWFVPTVMVGGAVVLALVMPHLDESVRLSSYDGFQWLRTTDEAARQTLSSLAGAMITAASVVFSLTMVVLSMTMNQFGPRLLRTFLRDRTTQVALGAFISTSVYCLLVLRNIHDPDDFLEHYELPNLSVLLGVLLALASLGILIYFIHHIATQIQAEHVVRSVAHDLDRAIDRIYPEEVGHEPAPQDRRQVETELERLADQCAVVSAQEVGYIKAVEGDALLALAREYDVVLELRFRPGDFLMPGLPLAVVRPARPVDDEFRRRLRHAFVLGTRRTPAQDVEAAIDELVEIAVRALSPSLNDPFTAIACIDYLGAALGKLLMKSLPGPCRLDQDGKLRIIATPESVASAIEAAFDQMRQFARGNVAVTIRLLDCLGRLALFAQRPDDAAALRRQAEMIERAAAGAIGEENDRADVQERFQRVLKNLETRSEAKLPLQPNG